MHTTLSEDELESYENDAEVMATIARNKITGLIAEKPHQFYVERTQVNIQTQAE